MINKKFKIGETAYFIYPKVGILEVTIADVYKDSYTMTLRGKEKLESDIAEIKSSAKVLFSTLEEAVENYLRNM